MQHSFRIAIGVTALGLMIAFLFSIPSSIFARGVSIIDTDIESVSGRGTFVRTKMDFGDTERLQSFPVNINEWASSNYDASKIRGGLKADAALARAYHHPTSSNPIFFYIIQSPDPSSFHPPPVCYRSIGFEIQSEDTIRLPVADIEYWAQEPIFGGEEFLQERIKINTKKLVIAKESNGAITDKRVALYYYVKDDWISSPKDITMIRVSALVPPEGLYQDILELEERLIADTFPLMFEPRSDEQTLANWLTDEGGIFGWVVLISLCAAPIGFAFYPVIRNLRSQG